MASGDPNELQEEHNGTAGRASRVEDLGKNLNATSAMSPSWKSSPKRMSTSRE